MMLINEGEIIKKLKLGDIAIFEQLYKEMQPRLFAFARKFTSDSDSARDLVQEVFIDLWDRIADLQINSSVRSYLFSMVHNKCLNQIRSQKVHNKYTSYTEIKIKEAELFYFDANESVHSSIFMKDIQEILDKQISELPEGCREVFKMSRIEGLENKQIAEKLDLSVRTVENQIYRALKVLKESLSDYLVVFIGIIIIFKSLF